jgi:hypothetical protein
MESVLRSNIIPMFTAKAKTLLFGESKLKPYGIKRMNNFCRDMAFEEWRKYVATEKVKQEHLNRLMDIADDNKFMRSVMKNVLETRILE